jgi:GNAT superfamily N-acetyltransferase
MLIKLAPASPARLIEVLQWLKEEEDRGDGGFYCNAQVIEKSFQEGEAVCAIAEDAVVGFSVFYAVGPSSGLSIIEVHPAYRNRGVGKKLIEETLKRLRQRGAEYVKADCTSQSGLALCIAAGFQPRIDSYPSHRPAVIARLKLELTPKAVTSAA